MLTGAQIRAARAMLGWSAKDLATSAGISYAAVQRAESTDGLPNMQSRNLASLKTAMEQAGIVFIDAGDMRPGGPGVRTK